MSVKEIVGNSVISELVKERKLSTALLEMGIKSGILTDISEVMTSPERLLETAMNGGGRKPATAGAQEEISGNGKSRKKVSFKKGVAEKTGEEARDVVKCADECQVVLEREVELRATGKQLQASTGYPGATVYDAIRNILEPQGIVVVDRTNRPNKIQATLNPKAKQNVDSKYPGIKLHFRILKVLGEDYDKWWYVKELAKHLQTTPSNIEKYLRELTKNTDYKIHTEFVGLSKIQGIPEVSS